MRINELRKILFNIYKIAVPIRYDEESFGGTVSRREKEDVIEQSQNIPEDIIYFNPGSLLKADTIFGLILFKNWIKRLESKRQITFTKDTAGTRTAYFSKEEFGSLLDSMLDLETIKLDSNIEYLVGEYLSASDGDPNFIKSSITNFKNAILGAWQKDKVLFIPLIFPEEKDNILPFDIEKEKERFEMLSGFDATRYKDELKINDVDNVDFIPNYLIHDVVGHGSINEFKDFLEHLNNFLKSIYDYLSLYLFAGTFYTKNNVENISDFRDLAKSVSAYLNMFFTFFGPKVISSIVGFEVFSDERFDQIFDSFLILASKGFALNEVPDLYIKRQYFKTNEFPPKFEQIRMNGEDYIKVKLNDVPDIRISLNEYKRSIEKARERVASGEVYSQHKGKILIQFL